jgi:hypothetical protein
VRGKRLIGNGPVVLLRLGKCEPIHITLTYSAPPLETSTLSSDSTDWLKLQTLTLIRIFR